MLTTAHNKLTETKQQKAARQFSDEWRVRGDEKSETQSFWLSLLSSVYGISNPQKFIEFEKRVQLSHVSFIDAYISSTKVLIEQKSSDIDLHKPYKQSDGSMLTPFQQAKRYANEMPYSMRPRWVVVCNFRSFLIYDMEQPHGEPQEMLLENLEKEHYRLQFIVDENNERLKRELEVSVKAGELVGVIYDKLLQQYIDPNDTETLRSLNILCVRLVFCLYAEDAFLFGSKTAFHDYLAHYEARDIRRALLDLFDALDTPLDQRDPYLDDTLKAFPYVNGGLFSKDERLIIPQFSEELKELLLTHASDDFDWSDISPTIFGAVFESTLNPDTRRKGGMHYTSIENIHKVIDPLFLDDLRNELEAIKREKVERIQDKKAADFQDKLASLRFLDPACGSGNFLTETFLSLRRLENEAIRIQTKGQARLGFEETNPIKVNIHQFYGIEINDFAVSVATTALWIAENQMLKETENIVDFDLDMLPLKSYHNITEGNALRMDWNTFIKEDDAKYLFAEKLNIYKVSEDFKDCIASETLSTYQTHYKELNVITKEVEEKKLPDTQNHKSIIFDYIMGNPPFVGARWMSKEQKEDVIYTFGKRWHGVGDLDYVCCWYKKASDLLRNCDKTKAAFVSTNSITQGGAVANLWKPLFQTHQVKFDFAYRTFRWDSESEQKAHVHCVIVGFSNNRSANNQRIIFDENGSKHLASNINGYLLDAPNIFIEKKSKPLCDVPQICLGGQPIDDGNFILTTEEKEEYIKKEPQGEKFLRPFMMGKDFIERTPRWCFWLMGANPSELRKCHEIMHRVANVRSFRLESDRTSTLRAAEMPTVFGAPFVAESDYIAIPKVSSEQRRYIPIDYLSKEIIPGDKLFVMQNASLYHFGVLTSCVHMAWTRAVCGRLKSDYSYSNTIVYNNFPWPDATESQQQKIEQTAQAIFDVRAKFPDCSLADLYDEISMPPELRKAHEANDKAVMQAFGFPTKMSESEIVAELFKMYIILSSQTQ